MSPLPPAVQAAYERLLATPPLATADLSVTVGQVLEQREPHGILCAAGTDAALRRLGLRVSQRDVVISLPAALGAGVDLPDVLRVIDACHPEGARILRLFAAECAEMVLPLYEAERPGDDRPRRAIEAARRYALGLIGAKELAAAGAAIGEAAWAAAGEAAWAATMAAAWAAAWEAIRAASWGATGGATRGATAQLLRRYHVPSERLKVGA